ncbi:hypothetical protein AA21291_0549 [Swaminathania salitolerans LMG 21291]|uniref:Uncharacterized protein n=2 Tax=Swaminathania salitolerans TaxID=182838 RepID=A0A511BPB1_9PROT|nr:hypothetical protein AA21291_0549 [Swaminathania salitolerans LMG 21291]GEL02157.1 hypothetical protein SSA02_13200 [Swaminathania salitolerans]
MEGAGVCGGLIVPSVTGFLISSALAGLPFNVINFHAMREVARLRPLHAARYMGLLTALFSIGQICGPFLVSTLVHVMASETRGLVLSLVIAGGALLVGAGLYVLIRILWPVEAVLGSSEMRAALRHRREEGRVS